MGRHRALALGLVLLLSSTGCSSGASDDREATTGTTARVTEAAAAATTTTEPVARSSPRWETVSTFSGSSDFGTPSFEILGDAIQWRVRWTCDAGALRITSTPPPRRPGPLVDARCPGEGDAYSIVTGAARLTVRASGPWTAIVDQQVDTPLDEPLGPDVAAAPVVAQGSFYDIEREGKGTVRLHRLPDGRRVLRFDGFQVSQNTDLFVWLSESPHPRTSAEAVAAPRTVLGNLKSTLGNQSYDVPADVPAARLRSVVIWCEPVAIAYGAASLTA